MPIDPRTGQWTSILEEAMGPQPRPMEPRRAPAGRNMPGVPDDVDLGALGLDEADWGVDYTPEEPQIRSLDEAYSPGWKGTAERYLPVLTEAFAAGDWQSPMARMAARLAGSVGSHLDSDVLERKKTIAADNVRETEMTRERNQWNRTQAGQNRASWLRTAEDRVPTPRDVLQRKLDEKSAEAAATTKARIESEITTRKEHGLNPTGTPKASTTKAKTYNPSSFRLYGDADKDAIKQFEDGIKDAETELKVLRNDIYGKQAWLEVRKVGGKDVEPKQVKEARLAKAKWESQIADLTKQRGEVAKRSILFQLKDLPSDATTALGQFTQLYRSAETLGLLEKKDDKGNVIRKADPDVDAALDEAAEALAQK